MIFFLFFSLLPKQNQAYHLKISQTVHAINIKLFVCRSASYPNLIMQNKTNSYLPKKSLFTLFFPSLSENNVLIYFHIKKMLKAHPGENQIILHLASKEGNTEVESMVQRIFYNTAEKKPSHHIDVCSTVSSSH